MNTAFVDYYRCPEKLVKLKSAVSLLPEIGYFSFGNNIICFGQITKSRVQSSPDKPLYDAFNSYDFDNYILPFDPTAVTNMLRREQYMQQANIYTGKHLINTVVWKLYYFLRAFLPPVLQKSFQRLYLQNWDKISFPRWPVDSSVEDIMERLLSLEIIAHGGESIPFIWFWPNGYKACIILTHDIDTLAGRDFCKHLMGIDEAYGFKSSFQIIPEKQYAVSEELLTAIRNKGFEINIHGLNHDGRLFWDYSEFLRRAERINYYGRAFGSAGFRSPMMYRNVSWFDALEFDYDMSIPNVGHLEAQRGGCCTVMPYFIGSILELPLTTIQDYFLFNILKDYSLSLWQKQIELIINKHGLINFLVHPDYIISQKEHYLYERLLEYLLRVISMNNIWVALPKEVNQWWRQRSNMELVEVNGEWKIIGPYSERASIAFAKLEKNRIVYEIMSRGR